MEREQEEQARQVKELQGQVERLQSENNRLWAHIEKVAILEKTREIAFAMHRRSPLIKESGSLFHDNVDNPADDELSSGSSPSLNLLSVKNTRESTCKTLKYTLVVFEHV